tara:strand:+ start:1208 stop:1561 length:354 start_codon:yes stop_codon:yes gene_type:complete
MNNIHCIIITILILLFFLISYNNCIDKFIDKNLNYENDGNMTFDYLLDNNYKNDVLNKYYINDDIKVNGKRLNIHHYQFKNNNNLYGLAHFQKTEDGKYGNYKTFAEYIYNTYGVRR